MKELLTIKEASEWASDYLKKEVTLSNISYLIQYGRIPKTGKNGNTLINKYDLKEYYKSFSISYVDKWKNKLGKDLNWDLSFSQYKESETTKHVHRLHPYKGKFIPQLVEYFLDEHTDNFKKNAYFKSGDIVLDPFCGSGTTLVQSNELGINALGVDVSAFNSLISNVKIGSYDIDEIQHTCNKITKKLKEFQKDKNNLQFENILLDKLKGFNNINFPSPEYKYRVRKNEVNEKVYGKEKESEFLSIYHDLIKKYNIKLKQSKNTNFIDKWYIQPVRNEIDFVFEQIKSINNLKLKKILSIILSRTIRSCRATTHSDLATLFEPQISTYYCKKHGKICKPLFSISSWWNRYSNDTIKRLKQFEEIRSNTFQRCFVGDSRNINLIEELERVYPPFADLLRNNKISGIFSSPPYVGLINYHEQHAYSYDLFGFDRHDKLEIGPLYKGQGMQARKEYTNAIAAVLINSEKYLKTDYNIFLVANDKYNLYPKIVELAEMKIVNQYKRPVLNRVEKSRTAYSETIFHIKKR